MHPTRRRILTAGASGVALLTLGSVGLGLRPGADTPVPQDLKCLGPTAYRVLEAVADRVCPGVTPSFPSARQVGVASLVDAHLATMHPSDAREIEQGLHLLENALAGLLLGGRTRPFTLCAPEQQDRVLAQWRSSRITVLQRAFKAFRSLCATAYYSDRATFAAVGYPGAPDYGQRHAPALQPVQQREVPA
ncbi:MAG: gluconate 2-dehydrogenase subunit 3 family protein [Myxococcales bacterium]|nr:gluconate 2-dehydrogenase subunit 3 family protein [Myxococcales bacterium]